LATTDDARVHCAVLKMRAVPVVPARGGSDPVLAEVRLPRRPVPQDPTACSIQATSWSAFRPASGRTNRPGRKRGPNNQCSTNERPPWNGRPGNGPGHANRMNPADAPVAP
jgi:hypothetical protein